MKRYRLALLFLTLLGSQACFSQVTDTVYNDNVDSFARTVKYHGDITALTRTLTAPYADQLSKARAIFIWITKNIRYNRHEYNKHYHRGKPYKGIKCKDDEDCEAKKEAAETKYIDRVLRRKKAICHGYALLFKRMCTIAGLKAEYISGYVRQECYQVGMTGDLIHAWNAVLIDSIYYLLDPTWAAGGVEFNEKGKIKHYDKSFNDYFWRTPPRDFVRDHFPEDPKWTLIPNYTIENFTANPYYEPAHIWELELIKPDSGIIHAKLGDTIRFALDYAEGIKRLQINSNIFYNPDIYVREGRFFKRWKLDTLAVKLQRYVPYQRQGNMLKFEYVVTDKYLYFLDILCDRDRIMRFDVKVAQ